LNERRASRPSLASVVQSVGFTILGFSIGLLIGFVSVLLKDGWLTVIEGFRPGRQLIVTNDLTTLGTSEKATLIFIAYGAKGVEPIHAVVERTAENSFVIRDQSTRTGTFVNEARIDGSCVLRDGDVIRLGVNRLRFNERVKSSANNASGS
jgi:hypothetical protein